jgi:hypothetical protein
MSVRPRSKSIDEIVNLNTRLQEASELFSRSAEEMTHESSSREKAIGCFLAATEAKESVERLVIEISYKTVTYLEKNKDLQLLAQALYPNNLEKQNRYQHDIRNVFLAHVTNNPK